jgi:acetoin utilization deacetylase AcuC-like enzyme
MGASDYGTAMPRPAYLRHEASLRHDTGEHPERADRMRAIERELASRDLCGFELIESPAAALDALVRVHPPEYVAGLEEFCAGGGGFLDMDTIVSEGSYEAARHAAGGSVRLVDMLLTGEAPTGFSAHRPPGHHAERARAMGFCLFNTIAVGARHAVAAHGIERVLVLDWDVHHGNGTNDIFHADRDVLFASIHQHPLYPGTGAAGDVGSGDGVGHTVNLPVPSGTGDAGFASLVEHVVLPLGRAYAPQLILVSAGYDAHRSDPLAGCEVTEAGYAAMASALVRLGAELDAPVGAVLEGGYHLQALSGSVVATMEALAAGPRAESRYGDLPVHPLARAALDRLARQWPALGAGAGL